MNCKADFQKKPIFKIGRSSSRYFPHTLLLSMTRYSHRPIYNARLYIVFISIAILLILALQYFWFSNSASSAIESSYRNISGSIHQTVSREYSRYDSLLDKIRLAQQSSFFSELSLQDFLSALIAEYGPANAGARLLLQVGYSMPSVPQKASLVKRTEKGWEREQIEVLGPPPAEIEKRMTFGDAFMYTSEGDTPEDVLLFEVHGNTGVVYRIGLWLDIDGFFTTYIEPAVASALAEYTITWKEVSAPLLMPERPDSNEPDVERMMSGGQSPERPETLPGPPKYRFNPLRGLLQVRGKPQSSNDRGLEVYVPRILLKNLNRNDSVSPPPEYRGASAHLGNYRSISSPSPERRDSISDTFRVATIRLPNSSLERAIEQRNSFYWLCGSALLIGIGIAFSFVVIQKDRIVKQRMREREFVSSVTHELRTPLTVIRSAAENIKTGIVPSERLQQYADLIMEQSGRLGKMIDDALSFARTEAGPQHLDEGAEVDTRELMEGLRESMDPLAIQAGLEILWDKDSLPPRFRGEENNIALILGNLIANAVYHAYPGKAKGTIRVSGGISRRGRVFFTVADDGRGIFPKDARRVFEPFYRDHVSRANQEKGSGLGLYLVKKTAAFIGASVRLESPYRREDGSIKNGCRFTLELPHTSEVKHDS
jgi:signal transduction histidine kinase